MTETLCIPQIKQTEIEIANLPSGLEGFKIVQISDLHVSPSIRYNWVQKVVEEVNKLDPDIIALTGDIVDGAYSSIGYDIVPLAGLTSRIGTYFVTGNHEYIYGVDECLRELRNMGFVILMNDNHLIARDNGLILLGGVADYSAPSPTTPLTLLMQ